MLHETALSSLRAGAGSPAAVLARVLVAVGWVVLFVASAMTYGGVQRGPRFDVTGGFFLLSIAALAAGCVAIGHQFARKRDDVRAIGNIVNATMLVLALIGVWYTHPRVVAGAQRAQITREVERESALRAGAAPNATARGEEWRRIRAERRADAYEAEAVALRGASIRGRRSDFRAFAVAAGVLAALRWLLRRVGGSGPRA